LLRDKELPERARSGIMSIRAEVRALMRLILNLLDISKSEEGKLSPALVLTDLSAMVEDVFEALEVRARAKNITLDRSIGAKEATADSDLLRRVLENLLENALRHAPEDSVVRVSTIPVDSGVELRIADSGGGIPPELRDSIFDRFVQVQSQDSAASRSGRGLGLAFCQLAVEAHGGRIWVEDGSPGAVFCVMLPHAS